MYALALDESGTHNAAPVLVIAGLAVHESDIRRLEDDLQAVIDTHLSGDSVDTYGLELHATELRSPQRARLKAKGRSARPASKWLTVDGSKRQKIFSDVYTTLTSFQPSDSSYPLRVFGAVVDRQHKQISVAERLAYDHVLHRYDEMLRTMQTPEGTEQRGFVIHDRRDGTDREVQTMAALWQRTGRRLDSLVQVPMFTDSRASRLVQAADFVAYGLARHYGPGNDDTLSSPLWPHVHAGTNGELSGVIHLHRDFKRRSCTCPPCKSRYPKAASS